MLGTRSAEAWGELIRQLGAKQFIERHPGFFLLATEEAVELSTYMQTVVPDKNKAGAARRRFEVHWVSRPGGEPGPVTVGRARTCEINFRHPSVSKVHAVLESDGKTLFVTDQGSRNGTQLNGKVLPARSRQKVVNHDRLHFGSVQTLVLATRDAIDLIGRMG
jgi:hypothetical protein